MERLDPSPAPAGRDAWRIAVATGGGVGYAPIISGTFGSLPGLALTWLAWQLAGPWGVVAGATAIILLGLATAGAAERRFGRRDPGQVVIDEIAGQMVTLLFVPPTWQVLAFGFVAFRIADVIKPFPGRRLEDLPGAWGIMADDLCAAGYAHVVLRLALWLAPAWFAL